MSKDANEAEPHVVSGEFFTDGATFIFRLKGLPISGAGPTPQAAFDDLIRAQALAGDLAGKLKVLAREQEGEQVRASLIRMFMIWLIALTVAGGLFAGLVALAPKLAADMAAVTASGRIVGNAPSEQSPAP